MGSGGGFARQADPFIDEGMRGEWYSSGAGPIDVPASDTLRFLIRNPIGSGRLLMIHRYRIHVTTASEYVQVIVNPTTNLPVTTIPSPNRFLGKPSGLAVLTIDPGAAMTGGSSLTYDIPVETGGATFTEFQIYPSIVVPPGFSIGTNYSNNTAGVSKGTVILDWREVPL